MSIRKIKVVNAEYVKEAESILVVGEDNGESISTQIHKTCFSYGEMNDEQIDIELVKTAGLLVGKTINLEFSDSV